jgi:hypothetical protein
MIWYTGTCGIMAIGLLCKRLIRLIASYDMVYQYMWYNGYRLTIWVNFMVNVCKGEGLWIKWFRNQGVAIPNG